MQQTPELDAFEVVVAGETVRVVCAQAEPAAWTEQVAAGDERTVFLGDGPTLAAASAIGERDLAAAACVLKRQGANGVDAIATPAGERALPADPAGEIVKTDTVFGPKSLGAHLDALNRGPLERVAQQLRSPMGVIPFVGAGMSKPFEFPAWGEFLRDAAQDAALRATVAAHVEKGEFEAAAELVEREDTDGFQTLIEDTFGIRLSEEQLAGGPLRALALLSRGPVITTNFDHALEQVFEATGTRFAEVIVGAQPDLIVRALHTSKRALLKIHGDADDRALRTFTAWEYDVNWGKDGDQATRRVTLSSLAWLLFTNRPLLFLGASLESDRTVDALREIHGRLRGLTHYAIMEASAFSTALSETSKRLRSCGVQPIWFAPKDFGAIERFLWRLLDRTLGQELKRGCEAPGTPPAGEDARARFAQAAPRPAADAAPSADVERIARAAVEGRAAFFLGAAAHLDDFTLGDPFVEGLAAKFDIRRGLTETRNELARRIVARQGEDEVLREVKAALAGRTTQPSVVYRTIAALPGLLRAHGRDKAASLLVLTTNYDTMLERCFADAGEPFHLLTYVGYGEHEGRFAHRAPDGAVRAIERPELLLAFREQGSLLVKLDGGIAFEEQIPESLLFARGDFERLSGRIPDALPAVLRRELRERSLVFLGHALAEADTEAIIRYANAGRREQRAWAVRTYDYDADYWSLAGLRILNAELGATMAQLHSAIERLA